MAMARHDRDGRKRCFVLLFALVVVASSQQQRPQQLNDGQQRLPVYSILPQQQQESHNVHVRAFPENFVPNNLPSGFRPSSPAPVQQSSPQTNVYSFEEDASPSPTQQVRRPVQPLDRDAYFNAVPVRSQSPGGHKQAQYIQNPKAQQSEEELSEELEDKEEPDRLSVLLQNSKFDCNARTTGYYADEGLACEVFHYCQANTKHSWICPEGFLFHQVHLICMPPSGDSICEKSSNYHYINDYLYKPLNAEEAERKPNVTLRYSDRYYPAEVYHDERYDVEDDEEAQIAPPQRAAQFRQNYQRGSAPIPSPAPSPNSVFRSPEDVNIPLLQRRPYTAAGTATTPYRQVTQQQQQQQHQASNEALDFEYE